MGSFDLTSKDVPPPPPLLLLHSLSPKCTLVQGSMSGMAMKMLSSMYSPHQLSLAKAAYDNATATPCNAEGKKTKACCSMCDYCDKCEACKVCDSVCSDWCKYCPQCPKDCVQSGYCGQVCNVAGLPESRPCIGCGCK